MALKKKKRKLSPEELTEMCIECGAKCCKYFSLEIDEPDCPDEYEDVRWYLCHENTWVFIDEGKWYLYLNNKCRYLDKNNLCSIYDKRPLICRKHNQKDCEINSDIFYDVLFKNIDDFEKYLELKGEKYW
ncbi:MAG: YkgJ family cysteine cluster protein [Chlamydiae bacterium]|nr:MAG: YkgJ family cysteine cluster protein [Chlamydiota bacterium]